MTRQYKVVSGDTLSGIAKRFYGNETLFPIIAKVNKIPNAGVIQAGMLLYIPDPPQHWEVVRDTVVFESHGTSLEGSTFRFIKVPEGMRLVIETVSGRYVGKGAIMGPSELRDIGQTAGYGSLAFFPWIQNGSVADIVNEPRTFAFNHYLRLYVSGPMDPDHSASGIGVVHGFRALKPECSVSGLYTITGYLEALPA